MQNLINLELHLQFVYLIYNICFFYEIRYVIFINNRYIIV